ncbi:MAG TPA: YceI family protein [Terriglobales bacterium]|nr:YceI family protein [Terriglobales bacterium]
MPIAGTPEATKVRYVIDPEGSTFIVRAFATGILSAFAHSPTIAIPDFQGEVQFASSTLEEASLRIVVQSASLKVTDDISARDRQEIERRMHDEVLEADGFAEIIYECDRVASIQKISEGQYAVTLDGELALHGVTRTQPVSARVTIKGETLRAAGEFTLRLSDYEIGPVSAAGGAVKLKDELKLSFDMTARKA